MKVIDVKIGHRPGTLSFIVENDKGKRRKYCGYLAVEICSNLKQNHDEIYACFKYFLNLIPPFLLSEPPIMSNHQTHYRPKSYFQAVGEANHFYFDKNEDLIYIVWIKKDNDKHGNFVSYNECDSYFDSMIVMEQLSQK